jgi:soluble cytochrome b562
MEKMRRAFFEVKDWAKEYLKKKIKSSIEFKGYMEVNVVVEEEGIKF